MRWITDRCQHNSYRELSHASNSLSCFQPPLLRALAELSNTGSHCRRAASLALKVSSA